MAGENQLQPVLMEGVRIIFRNFEGKEGQYNRAGVRNFGVIIPPDPQNTAEAMLADGWNVKHLKPSEEEKEEGIEEGPAWLPVEVAYDKGRPPKIVLVTDRGRTTLDEDTVDMLDWADITNVDLIVNPYPWGPNSFGKSGIKAYLKSMYVTIEEDELERKYAEMDAQ